MFIFFFLWYRDPRDLHVLTHSFPTRRSSDRQLDPVKQQLTQTVLQEVEGIDHWTIYRALSEPLEGLGGRSPVDAVTHGTIDDVAEAVFNVLGVQVH